MSDQAGVIRTNDSDRELDGWGREEMERTRSALGISLSLSLYIYTYISVLAWVSSVTWVTSHTLPYPAPVGP